MRKGKGKELKKEIRGARGGVKGVIYGAWIKV
jgi:hypothetical protein